MTIRITDADLSNNGGDGLRAPESVNLQVEGLRAHGNGGSGVNILESAFDLRTFGLPEDLDKKALVELLQALQSVLAEDREEAVRKSGFFQRFGRLAVDGTTLAANIASLSSNNSIQEIIKRFVIRE